MKNEYGLDVDYFEKKLKTVLRDVKCYTPYEMFNELSRLCLVAADQDDMTVEIKVKNLHRHKQCDAK